MGHRRLGHPGPRVPAVGGGGNDLIKTWGAADAKGAMRLVDVCLEHGVSMFESAGGYSSGLAEEILGAAIKGKRNRLLISTKAAFPSGTGPNDYDCVPPASFASSTRWTQWPRKPARRCGTSAAFRW